MSRKEVYVDNIPSQRIRALRKERGMLQEELADKLNEIARRHGEESSYSGTTVSKWESRGSTPRLKSLKYLSEIFDVSVNYLSGETDELTYLHTLVNEHNEYRQLDIKELDNHYDGLPVWIQTENETKKGVYGLVDSSNHTIRLKDGKALNMHEVRDKVYAAPNPFTVSMRALDEPPLELEEIDDGLDVWIEWILTPEELKEQYRGWYRCDRGCRAFIGANGLPLPFNLYGIKFVAFNRML